MKRKMEKLVGLIAYNYSAEDQAVEVFRWRAGEGDGVKVVQVMVPAIMGWLPGRAVWVTSPGEELLAKKKTDFSFKSHDSVAIVLRWE